MKKVAGKLRLDLSQYRDLEAFAQFGSELDAETQKALTRGERLVELLKQKEREPLSVGDQVASIYSGTGGFLDRIKTERVGEFLADLRTRLHAEKSELLAGSKRAASSPTRTRRSSAPRSATSSTTSAPTSTSTATRSRGESDESNPRRSARRRPGPPVPETATGVQRRKRSEPRPKGEGRTSRWRRRRKSRTIASIKNINKITRAMDVAAARLRRAEHRIDDMRPYAEGMRKLTRRAAAQAGGIPRQPFLGPARGRPSGSGSC